MTEQVAAKAGRPNADSFNRAGIVWLASGALFVLVDAVTIGTGFGRIGQAFGAAFLPALIVGLIARFSRRRWPVWLYVVLVGGLGILSWLSGRAS